MSRYTSLEGEARTWYDLRAQSITEDFATFAGALEGSLLPYSEISSTVEDTVVSYLPLGSFMD